MKEQICFVMVVCLLFVFFLSLLSENKVKAASTITSMDYFSVNDGPVITKTGSGQASFGFVMPVFNGGNANYQDVAADLVVRVLVNGTYIDIDNSSFVYNVNWGNWSDGGFYGYWFTITETTHIQLASKSSGVTLNYTLEFNNVPKTTITSMNYTQGPNLTAGVTGSVGFTYPIFNGDNTIPYAAVAEDLKVYVKAISNNTWIDIDNNAASGWIYDSNFGQFSDGGGGYWFTVTESIHVKLESKTTLANLVYTITYNEAVRNSYTLTPYDGTTYTADNAGAIGIPLPKIDGSAAYKKELDNFVYEIKINNNWVLLSDQSVSTFRYSNSGYNNLSDANQWGYWVDHIYGLWFQPIQVDMEIRIGYPLNGIKGANVGSNYVYYTFIGNPNAPRPDVTDLEDIVIGTPNNWSIPGMNLVWQDEFIGTTLDTTKWNYEIGYYMSDDPNSWGWGNNELEHYTNSERNVNVQNGVLNITTYNEPKSFPQDPNRYALYSSGKITTKDKFSIQYGRVDIRAKLPTGNGLWPALWMLPVNNTYGAWAASGEIDIMEAKGRLPGITSGALHYGGQWPVNRYLSGEYIFPNGQTFESDYHVYTVIWEEDNFKWYVDGRCFLKITREQWYSVGAPNNTNAPFDQPFYLIMNLAVGGNFDGGLVPDPSDIPATMEVDYVRAYKVGDDNGNTIPVTGISLNNSNVALSSIGETKNLLATIIPNNATNQNVIWNSSNTQVASVNNGVITAISNGTAIISATSVDGGFTATCTVSVSGTQNIEFIIGDSVRGIRRLNDQITFYVNGANFADIHYKLNNGIQQNLAMTSDGNRNFTYILSNLNYGDQLEYFFTYNLGSGALDTETFNYVHGVTTGQTSNPSNLALNKTVSVSGVESETLGASNLVDGNSTTRWSSNFADDAWFIIDLQVTYTITQLEINWEAAYAKSYQILTSTDGVNYSQQSMRNDGIGGIESLNLSSINARYVKFQGIERALPYGYSIWDVKVIGF